MTTRPLPASIGLLLLFLLSTNANLYAESESSAAYGGQKAHDKTCDDRQYVFSWNMTEDCLPTPRGGSSRGAPVTLATAPTSEWHALQAKGLSDFERDRRAILAMAGGYRTSFEFVETIGFTSDYALARPYQSWGTEYVYVVEDSSDFISLQHVMVMYMKQEDGSISEPIVMKHWRQDWKYEGREILEFIGNKQWRLRKLDRKAVKGRWSQSVYQVDDSPRYASVGRWQHTNSFSVWESDKTWRPLPRREHTVRDDYQVLEAINRHVILPTGWVHEEDNLKRRLSDSKDQSTDLYIAKELGNNRYQRVKDFDWSAGDTYWKDSGPFWKVVRSTWHKIIRNHQTIAVHPVHDGIPMLAALFEKADVFQRGELENPEETVVTALKNYVHY